MGYVLLFLILLFAFVSIALLSFSFIATTGAFVNVTMTKLITNSLNSTK